MRILLTLILLGAGGWSVYWYALATAKERVLTAWLADRQAAGWIAEAGALNVGGFPYRFETRITDLNIADPAAGYAWQAPGFDFLSQSYQPNHVIAIWPQSQVVRLGDLEIAVGAEVMRGSIRFHPDTALSLAEARVELANVALTGGPGWTAGLENGIAALRDAGGGSLDYDFAFSAKGARPTVALRTALDPGGLLPEAFDSLEIDARFTMEAAIDRHAVEAGRIVARALDLRRFRAEWGVLDLRAGGKLGAAPGTGLIEGRLTLQARNWRQMLELAVNAGAIPRGMAQSIETGLGLIAGASGNAEAIEVPLNFGARGVFLGPVPLSGPVRIFR